MAVTTFAEMLQDIKNKGGVVDRSKTSMTWLKGYVKNLDMGGKTRDKLSKGKLTGGKLMANEAANLSTKFKLGRMAMFFYDPKLKEDLPYFDRFPCIFPLCPKKGANDVPGFLGLNIHYLPIELRAKLMDDLYKLENNARLTENKRVEFTYGTLLTMSNYWKPCLKHYLTPHVRSKFLQVPYEAWPLAMLLPLAQFEGASTVKIFNDSRKLIK